MSDDKPQSKKVVIHTLKTEARFFMRVWNGDKTAELRRNSDRDFQMTDELELIEIDGPKQTGRHIRAIITHVLSEHDALKGRYSMISFTVVGRKDTKEVEE